MNIDSIVEPWPSTVSGDRLLKDIAGLLRRFVVLPKWAEQTLALWVLHTYAFELRDVTTYVGIESPEKRCGKTTLLTIVNELVNRPVVAANISSSAFFRVIEEIRPTLLIDEADTFLQGNDELRGILNSGYKRKTAFVVRVTNERTTTGPQDDRRMGPPDHGKPLNGLNKLNELREEERDGSKLQAPSSRETRAGLLAACPAGTRLARFSCWCPKIMAAIGRLPDTLADRCIVIRMQRKTMSEQCERMRDVDTTDIRRQCLRFVLDNAEMIAAARPEIPAGLNDRAADIWEPLFALADLAAGSWPQRARQAAVGLGATASEANPISSLLLDIALAFALLRQEKVFSRELVNFLKCRVEEQRPWAEVRNGKPVTELWLAQQLRPYGIRPRMIWTAEEQARGYVKEDFRETFDRYIPKAEARAYLEEWRKPVARKDEPREKAGPQSENQS